MSEQAPVGSSNRPPLLAAPPRNRAASGSRVAAGFLFTVCMAVIGVSLWLKPDPSGFGTHRQLGLMVSQHELPPCTSKTVFGLPCPTCGMTTAFAYTFRGQFWSAAKAQPAGLMLALCLLAGAVLSAMTAVTGRSPTLPRSFTGARPVIFLAIVLVAGWVVKLLEAVCVGTLRP